MAYDSRPETQQHINQVILECAKFVHILKTSTKGLRISKTIDNFIRKLQNQVKFHDYSKLINPELEGFNIYTPKLAGMTYGSEEYKQCLQELKPYLDHHYSNNSHHPEHFTNGINGMTLYDVIEMYCDWNAAVKRHKDGNINRSIDINEKRFNMDKQLSDAFRKTVEGNYKGSLHQLIYWYCAELEGKQLQGELCEQIKNIFKNTFSKNCSVTAMAFEKKVAKKKIEDQSNNLISWWCLLDYFKRFEDINNLTPHEQGKLAGLLKSLSEIDFKKTDSIKARRKVLNDYWKDNGWDYDKYPERIVTVFSDKFLEENIKKDYSKWDIVAQDFVKDMDIIIIELVAKGGRTAIDNYVKQKFGV